MLTGLNLFLVFATVVAILGAWFDWRSGRQATEGEGMEGEIPNTLTFGALAIAPIAYFVVGYRLGGAKVGLEAAGFSVARSQVVLADPIKAVGLHSVPLALHAEVAVSVNVNVARSDDEAARQASGEDLTVQTFDDEAAAEFAAGQAEAGSAAADAYESE